MEYLLDLPMRIALVRCRHLLPTNSNYQVASIIPHGVGHW
jgi:hypothetical protein